MRFILALFFRHNPLSNAMKTTEGQNRDKPMCNIYQHCSDTFTVLCWGFSSKPQPPPPTYVCHCGLNSALKCSVLLCSLTCSHIMCEMGSVCIYMHEDYSPAVACCFWLVKQLRTVSREKNRNKSFNCSSFVWYKLEEMKNLWTNSLLIIWRLWLWLRQSVSFHQLHCAWALWSSLGSFLRFVLQEAAHLFFIFVFHFLI